MLVFRWAFGYNSYYWRSPSTVPLHERFFREVLDKYKSKWSGSSIPEEVFMLKLAVDSAQVLYPGNRYVIMNNSSCDLENLISGFQFREPVEIIHKSDFTSPFPFDPPESVWWKWIPLSMGDVDIFVDIDSIFLGKQSVLPEWVQSKSPTLFVRELIHSKYSYKLPIVAKMQEHINVGFVAAKKESVFGRSFVYSSKSISYTPGEYWSNFFAESECGNLTYLRLKSNSTVADGGIFTWWDSDFITSQMEWCHFLGAERKVAMMAFYSLLQKFVELGTAITNVDKEVLLALTTFGTPRALESAMPVIFSDVVKKHYNRLCLLYNVKCGVRPPVDLIDPQPDFIPANAIFIGVEKDGNLVKSTHRYGYHTYTVEGDLFGELKVRCDIKCEKYEK